MSILQYNSMYSQFQIIVHSKDKINLCFYTGNKKAVSKNIWSIIKYDLNKTWGNKNIYEKIKPIIKEIIHEKNTNFTDQPVRRSDLFYGGFYVGTGIRNKKDLENSFWIWDPKNYKFQIMLFNNPYELITEKNGKRLETEYTLLVPPQIVKLSDYQNKVTEKTVNLLREIKNEA